MAPRRKQFSKKTSTTYALVNRPQHDPLIHDNSSSSHVFTEVAVPSGSGQDNANAGKIRRRGDLEEEFGLAGLVRENEGEAAEHGVFYDDSHYDYMQHLRDLGSGAGEAAWIEASNSSLREAKGKARLKLEDALKDMKLVDVASPRHSSHHDLSWSEEAGDYGPRMTYEEQQDIPDGLHGFQPHMDPRLREVLEALDNEAYLNDEEDTFAELAGDGGEEMDQEEWEAIEADAGDGEDDWESDETAQPEAPSSTPAVRHETANLAIQHKEPAVNVDVTESMSDGDWFADFAKSKTIFEQSAQAPRQGRVHQPATSTVQSSATVSRRKKRKGAVASSTGFSMTSSSLPRTEALSTLDSRFERVAASYMDSVEETDEHFDDTASVATGGSRITTGSRWAGASQASGFSVKSPTNEDEAPRLVSAAEFDGVLNDFLSGPNGRRGRKMKKGGRPGEWGVQGGMAQLDEIRSRLGSTRWASRNSTGVQV